MLGLLQSWVAAAEALWARVAELAVAVGARSWPLAAVPGAAGLALLVAGRRLGPLLAAAGGAVLGWLAGSELSGIGAGWALPPSAPAWAAAAVIGIASAFAPSVYLIALGAVPGALLGLRVPLTGRVWLGAAVGALLLAGIALALRRVVLAATAAIPGAALTTASIVALSVRFPALTALTNRPVLLAALGALLAVAGTAFQLGAERRHVASGARGGRARTMRRE